MSRVLITAGLLAALATAPARAETRVRIVAANLSSGTTQDYNLGHGQRILQGLKPDIVLIQEWNVGDGSASTLRQWVNATLGEQYQLRREEQAKGIPNGIISRFPIISKGEWDDATMEDRDFAWARIGLPGNKALWAISVHLSHKNKKKRKEQAEALVKPARQHIPPGDMVVLGGDFNTKDRSDEAVLALDAFFETDGPHPADHLGDEDTNANRKEPYDWIVADAELQPLKVPTIVGSQSFEHGLVFDSRDFSPLSDVTPVRPDDSAAIGMQHMAVVRDFRIP